MRITIESSNGHRIEVTDPAAILITGPGPRKTTPRVVDTTGYTVDDDATVIRPAQFARAS